MLTIFMSNHRTVIVTRSRMHSEIYIILRLSDENQRISDYKIFKHCLCFEIHLIPNRSSWQCTCGVCVCKYMYTETPGPTLILLPGGCFLFTPFPPLFTRGCSRHPRSFSPSLNPRPLNPLLLRNRA